VRGVRTAGRLMILLGLLLALVWMFTPLPGAGDRSLWEFASRFDVLMAAAVVAAGAVALRAFLVERPDPLDRALGVIAGAVAAALTLLALELQWSDPLLVQLACIAALLMLAGAALLALSEEAADRLAASLRGSRPMGRPAVRRRELTTPAGAPVPAGWYPDPSGAYATRYWDGHAWTEHVQ
jgi:hypothetical protein